MFQKSDKAKMSLLNHEAGQLRRDSEAKNSIVLTWQISFDHILETRPSAAELLALMSFFDGQGIPEELIRNKGAIGGEDGDDGGDMGKGGDTQCTSKSGDEDDSLSESSFDDRFETDIVTLRNYSFVSVTADAKIFEMHGLVQLATRKWLEAHGQLERWKRQYIRNLRIHMRPGKYENWTVWQMLFPHVKSALTQQPGSEESLAEWATILYYGAWYAWARGSYPDAERMSVKSMKVRKKLFKQEHQEVLHSIAMVALAYRLGGRWKEAEELEVQVMEISLRVLGEEYPF